MHGVSGSGIFSLAFCPEISKVYRAVWRQRTLEIRLSRTGTVVSYVAQKTGKTYKKPLNKGIIKGISLLLSDNDTRKIQMRHINVLILRESAQRMARDFGKNFFQ